MTPASDLYTCLALFLVIVMPVNLYWWSIYYETATLMSIFFYAYNVAHIVFVASIMRWARDAFSAATQLGLLAAVSIEIAATLLFPASTFRAVGTFNNPEPTWLLGFVGRSLLAGRPGRSQTRRA
jgi:hypothetical protein